MNKGTRFGVTGLIVLLTACEASLTTPQIASASPPVQAPSAGPTPVQRGSSQQQLEAQHDAQVAAAKARPVTYANSAPQEQPMYTGPKPAPAPTHDEIVARQAAETRVRCSESRADRVARMKEALKTLSAKRTAIHQYCRSMAGMCSTSTRSVNGHIQEIKSCPGVSADKVYEYEARCSNPDGGAIGPEDDENMNVFCSAEDTAAGANLDVTLGISAANVKAIQTWGAQ